MVSYQFNQKPGGLEKEDDASYTGRVRWWKELGGVKTYHEGFVYFREPGNQKKD